MTVLLKRGAYICARCAYASRRTPSSQLASYSSQATKPEDIKKEAENKKHSKNRNEGEETSSAKELGPMARRLEEATEEALFIGGKAGRQAIHDAGFSEELKEKLLDKIADAKFRTEFSSALSQAELSSSAGEGTRHIAGSEPWAGEEATADTVLRMLDDARKPLKPGLRGKYQPPPVDMRLKKETAKSPGMKAATARDRASIYAGLGLKSDAGLSDKEKEERRRLLKERFDPGARALPNTISGLAALANERIEDAIARGQFKNIPRGKGVERDARSDNPFIDTTEYIMNKMIQRQDIVPPWIEKQQELIKAAGSFRTRLRNDWKRHAARMIASSGGSLQEQMKRAEDFAAAEALHNPRQRSVDQIPVPSSSTDDPVMVKMQQQAQDTVADIPQADPGTPLPKPFRDAAWEKTEQTYLDLSIENLNRLTRGYNLMAPDLAKKPYFSLQRELASCYADMAPLVANEIKERALGRRGPGLNGPIPEKRGGIFNQFGGKGDVKIHLEADEKAYGLKQWWRDFWKKS